MHAGSRGRSAFMVLLEIGSKRRRSGPRLCVFFTLRSSVQLSHLNLIYVSCRCEAAWRFKAATQAAVAAPLLGGYHRAARAGHPRCSGGSGDASRLIDASLPPLMALQKSRQTSAHFFLDCASACGVRVCSWKELTSGFPTV